MVTLSPNLRNLQIFKLKTTLTQKEQDKNRKLWPREVYN
jgi:hypothetical protein